MSFGVAIFLISQINLLNSLIDGLFAPYFIKYIPVAFVDIYIRACVEGRNAASLNLQLTIILLIQTVSFFYELTNLVMLNFSFLVFVGNLFNACVLIVFTIFPKVLQNIVIYLFGVMELVDWQFFGQRSRILIDRSRLLIDYLSI